MMADQTVKQQDTTRLSQSFLLLASINSVWFDVCLSMSKLAGILTYRHRPCHLEFIAYNLPDYLLQAPSLAKPVF